MMQHGQIRSPGTRTRIRIPLHFCLLFLFLDHLNLTVLSLCIAIAYSAGMLRCGKKIFLNTHFRNMGVPPRINNQVYAKRSCSANIWHITCVSSHPAWVSPMIFRDWSFDWSSHVSGIWRRTQKTPIGQQTGFNVFAFFYKCAVLPALLPNVMLNTEYGAFFGWLAFERST